MLFFATISSPKLPQLCGWYCHLIKKNLEVILEFFFLVTFSSLPVYSVHKSSIGSCSKYTSYLPTSATQTK